MTTTIIDQVSGTGTSSESAPHPVTRGGTGAASLTDHGVLIGSGTDPVAATAALTDGQILVGQTGADPAPRTVSGDVSLMATGEAAIADNAVTFAKMADIATARIVGRSTAGTGDPEALTAAQAAALLPAVVGDGGSGGTKGLVPAPAAGDASAGRFLKADGTWTVPAGAAAPVGSVVDYAGWSAPAGWLFCYGQAISRSTYADLFAALRSTATTTMTIASPCVVSWSGHALKINDPVVFRTTGGLPTGITTGTVYYVISAGFGANSFRVATTPGGSAVNTSGSQSGTHTGF